MTNLPVIRESLEQSFVAIETLGADLTAAEWEAQSLCPKWTARDVVNHVVSIENALVSWVPESSDSPPPFALAAAFSEETMTLDSPAFMDRVCDVFDRRRRNLATLSAADLAVPSWTPVGPATYGRFMEIRIFDFWVHERDISTPLGRPADDTSERGRIALAEVEGSLGYIVGKRVGLPDRQSIVFHLDGPHAHDIAVLVDGRAKVVESVAQPNVEVWTDTLTFIQLACGRIDPQKAIDSRTIRWSGDAEFGERAARNLRFTM